MKYIDAEKLKLRIAQIQKEHPYNPYSENYESGCHEGYLGCCDELLSLIDSLQPEHPKVDLEKEIEWEWVHREKQEIDLIEYAEMDKEAFVRFARHFYELGQSMMRKRFTDPECNQRVIEKMKFEYPANESNARKEE